MNKAFVFLLALLVYFASVQAAMPSRPNDTDYFTLLNISQDASVDVIKDAYTDLVLQWHPDKLRRSKNSQDRSLAKEIIGSKALLNKHFRNAYKYFLSVYDHEAAVGQAQETQARQEASKRAKKLKARTKTIKDFVNQENSMQDQPDELFKNVLRAIRQLEEQAALDDEEDAQKELCKEIEDFFIKILGVEKVGFSINCTKINKNQVIRFFDQFKDMYLVSSQADFTTWIQSLENPIFQKSLLKKILDSLGKKYFSFPQSLPVEDANDENEPLVALNEKKLQRIQALRKAHITRNELEEMIHLICWAFETILPENDPIKNSFQVNLQRAVLDFFAEHLHMRLDTPPHSSSSSPYYDNIVRFGALLFSSKHIENEHKLKAWITGKNKAIGKIFEGLFATYKSFFDSFPLEKISIGLITAAKKNKNVTSECIQAIVNLLWISCDSTKSETLRLVCENHVESYLKELSEQDILGNSFIDLTSALRNSPHAHEQKFKEVIARFDARVNDQILTLLGKYKDPSADQNLVYIIGKLISNFPHNSSTLTKSERALSENSEKYFLNNIGVTKSGDSYTFEALGGNDLQSAQYKSSEAIAFRSQMVRFLHGFLMLHGINPTQIFDTWLTAKISGMPKPFSIIIQGLYYHVYLPMRLQSMINILNADSSKLTQPGYTDQLYAPGSLKVDGKGPSFGALQAFNELMYYAQHAAIEEHVRAVWKNSADAFMQLKKDLAETVSNLSKKDELSERVTTLRNNLTLLQDKFNMLSQQLSVLKASLG